MGAELRLRRRQTTSVQRSCRLAMLPLHSTFCRGRVASRSAHNGKNYVMKNYGNSYVGKTPTPRSASHEPARFSLWMISSRRLQTGPCLVRRGCWQGRVSGVRSVTADSRCPARCGGRRPGTRGAALTQRSPRSARARPPRPRGVRSHALHPGDRESFAMNSILH